MTAIQYVLAIVLILLCIAIVAVVLMQESRSAGLSGAIAGGADTFFGKGKGKSMEKKLEKVTKIFAGIFFALTLGITVFFMFKYHA
ncbi:MAG: preprotein translocase subunit SecG [Clostridia bacterium]|nr:preprotein translocase subunit SecG [Clostridia bacterium]MCQ2479811.1 preprotein translocase subunit SecG [Clostridia bacterium]